MPFDWNNILVVSKEELVPAHYPSIDSVQQDVSRSKKRGYGIEQVRRGGKGREPLYRYDSLRQEVQNALGDPRKVGNALDLFYRTDPAAVQFFTREFRFEDGGMLALRHQEEYITNASVLRAAILLKARREHERKKMGSSCKGVLSSICRDVAAFNEVLRVKYDTRHSLPGSEKRFKEGFKAFAKGLDYTVLISGTHRNQNRKLMTDELLELLNNMFAAQTHKPTRTEVAGQYEVSCPKIG